MSLGVTRLTKTREQQGVRRMRDDDHPFVIKYCRYNRILNLGISQSCMAIKKAETGLWGANLKRNLYIGSQFIPTSWLTYCQHTTNPRLITARERESGSENCRKLKCAGRTVPSPQHCKNSAITEPEELAGQLRNGNSCEDYLKQVGKGVMIMEIVRMWTEEIGLWFCCLFGFGFFPFSESRKWSKDKKRYISFATLKRNLTGKTAQTQTSTAEYSESATHNFDHYVLHLHPEAKLTNILCRGRDTHRPTFAVKSSLHNGIDSQFNQVYKELWLL